MDTETLTCKVCEARADYGITQQQLADAMSAPATIGMVEPDGKGENQQQDKDHIVHQAEGGRDYVGV